MKVGDMVRINRLWAYMFTSTEPGIIVDTDMDDLEGVMHGTFTYQVLWPDASVKGYVGEELELVSEGD